MVFRVRFSESAKRDLREIFEYITANYSDLVGAAKYIGDIRKKIASLTTFPERFAIYEDVGIKGREIRTFIIRRHRVLYTVNHIKKEVEIQRIVFVRRSLKNILKTLRAPKMLFI